MKTIWKHIVLYSTNMWMVSRDLQSCLLDLLATISCKWRNIDLQQQLTQQKTNFSKLGLFDNPIITGNESNPNTRRAEIIT